MNRKGLDQQTVQLTSCANKTKWLELQQRMASQWYEAPMWRAKYLPPLKGGTWELSENGANRLAYVTFGDEVWDGEWYYHFRFDNDYKSMEWVELKPKLHDKAMDLETISSICREIGFDFEVDGGLVRVFGYRMNGEKIA